MKTRKTAALISLALGILAGWSAPRAIAQSDTPVHLTYAAGSVSVQPGAEGDWIKLSPGNVLGPTDNLWADQNSRAELYIGRVAIRMKGDTSLTLQRVDAPKRLKLWLGSVIVHVPQGDEEIVRIETPNLLFRIAQPGDYRLDVNVPGDETIATVWSGEGEAINGSTRYTIDAEHSARLSGTDNLQLELNPPAAPDDFDTWAFNRDRSGKPEESQDANADSDSSTAEADAGAASDSGVWTEDPGVWTELDAYPALWAVLVSRGCPCGAPPPAVILPTSPARKPVSGSTSPKPVNILRPLGPREGTNRPQPPNFREPEAKSYVRPAREAPTQSHPAPPAESHHSSESSAKSDAHSGTEKH